MRALPILLCGLAGTSTAAAAPPAPFAGSMQAEKCDSVAWTAMSAHTWFAYCVAKDRSREGREVNRTDHRGFVFHHPRGAATFDKLPLFDGSSQEAVRGVDLDQGVKVAVKGTRVTVSMSGYSGDVQIALWNLAVYPPRLEKYSYGGGSAWSRPDAPTSPTCTVDLGRRRDTCKWERPDCGHPDEGFDPTWDGETVRFRSVPTLSFLSPRRAPSDPFTCAAIFGDDPVDVYFGKNPGRTTFEAVADHVTDPKPSRVILHLRAKDSTPAQPDKAGAWHAADHWEIWLARAGDANVTWRDDRKGYCAARGAEYVQLIVAPHRDGSIELANGTPKARGSTAGASARAGASGEVVVELGGRLAEWASDGGLTVSYSDSLDGKKQDTLIGSSRVAWGKPGTFGRLGRDVLCGGAGTEKPEALPWDKSEPPRAHGSRP